MSDEKKQRPSGADNNRRVIRIPGALIFWVLLLIVFGVMFFWKSSGANPVAQWDQSRFEQRIADVIKAKVIPEGEDMLYIEGEYKLNEAELAAAKAKNAKAGSTGKFRTRVLKSEQLSRQLEKTNVQIQPKDNWFTSLLSLVLPVLIIGIIIYLVAGAVAGAVIGLLAGIPIVGFIFGLIGSLLGIYVTAGIVIQVLVFCKVLK